jgi:hypothetical protein
MPALTFSSISAFGISLRLFRPAILLSDELALHHELPQWPMGQ